MERSRSRIRRAGISLLLAAGALAAGASPALADYPAEVRADNPEGYFRMADSDATMRNEIAGHGDGHHRNSPLLGVESALPNDTADRSVGYRDGNPDRSDYLFGTVSDFSVEFFMKSNQAVGAGITNWYEGFGLVDAEISGVTNDWGTALVGGGKVGFGIGNPDITIKSTTTVNDFNWHHVVATWDSGFGDPTGTMKLYIDGNLEAQSTAHPGGSRSPVDFTVGSLDTNILEYVGAIDEVAFYRHVLPASDVTQHYGARNDAPAAPPPAPHKVTVYPSGGGRGSITGPGIDCQDAGLFLQGVGDCEEAYPAPDHLTFVNAVPNPGSRFSHWTNAFADHPCEGTTTPDCFFSTQSDVNSTLSATFHLTGESFGNALNATNDGLAKTLEKEFDDAVDPNKKADIKFANGVPVTVSNIDVGQQGGGLIGKVRADLIGSDGATLVGNAGNTLTSQGPTVAELIGKVRLVGPDGTKLIGSDGATLIGSDGATFISEQGGGLIGSDGATRSQHRPAQRAAKPKFETVFYGTYSTAVDESGAKTVTFKTTKLGRAVMEAVGKENLARAKEGKKPRPLGASLIEVIKPADGIGAGGSLEQVCITKLPAKNGKSPCPEIKG